MATLNRYDFRRVFNANERRAVNFENRALRRVELQIVERYRSAPKTLANRKPAVKSKTVIGHAVSSTQAVYTPTPYIIVYNADSGSNYSIVPYGDAGEEYLSLETTSSSVTNNNLLYNTEAGKFYTINVAGDSGSEYIHLSAIEVEGVDINSVLYAILEHGADTYNISVSGPIGEEFLIVSKIV
jgi:hypothetical protein